MKPFSSNAAIASLTAGVDPAMTVILGEFLLAAITYPSIDSITAATSSYSAVTLAIRPLSSISTEPISVPRAAAALKAESMSMMPDDIKAAYSPRECPATISGYSPWSLSDFSIAKSAVSMAG